VVGARFSHALRIPERKFEMPVVAYLLLFLLLSAALTWFRVAGFRRRYRQR